MVLHLATAVRLPVHHQHVILPLGTRRQGPQLLAAGVARATGDRARFLERMIGSFISNYLCSFLFSFSDKWFFIADIGGGRFIFV